MEAVFVRLGEGEQLELGHAGAVELLGATEGGSLSATVARVAPGMATVPPHFHRHHSELILVMGGELEMTLGERTVAAGPGCVAMIPPGVVHAFRNVGEGPATFLEVSAPAGLERFIRDLADQLPGDRPPDRALLDRIAAQHDVVHV